MNPHIIHLLMFTAAVAAAVALAYQRCYFLAFCCLVLAGSLRSNVS